MTAQFGGRIGSTWRDSEPWWPAEPAPPPGAPNILLVVLDDVGYAQLGCYGSDIETPVLDGLAESGVRLANFHTTALCSPTRACLLTGRNHHRSGMGRIADLAIGYPGYWGKPPRENGYLPEILRATGYASYAIGKWHLSPEDETNMAASRASWPLARGFDRWYGFHGGETHQLVPALYHDNHAVRPPDSVEAGYHLTEDLADRAIEFLGDLRAVDPAKPFFLYFATGACHSPHQPPRRWLERYRGRFEEGWDVWREQVFARQLATGLLPAGTALSPRPPWVPRWDSLGAREQALAARFMECFAGFLSHADEQIGRVLDFLRERGELDSTVVCVVSDNGASAEGGAEGSINDIRLVNIDPAGTDEMFARLDEIGGPLTHNNYPWGWTMAGNTPFRRWKREVHEGGVADPCIISWPRGTELGLVGSGAVRHQFAHAIDVLPTLAELARIPLPAEIDGIAQTPVDGISFAYLLPPGTQSAPGQHETQYFEMFGSRAIYHRGWKAVTFHPVGPLYDDQNPNAPFEDDVWELYHVAEDLSESRDLAPEQPGRLAELIELWWAEARRNQVLPLDNRALWALVHPKPDRRQPRDEFRYHQGGAPVPESVAVNIRNRSHLITVDLTIPDVASPDLASPDVASTEQTAIAPTNAAPTKPAPATTAAADAAAATAAPATTAAADAAPATTAPTTAAPATTAPTTTGATTTAPTTTGATTTGATTTGATTTGATTTGDGVLLALGSALGGWSLHIFGGRIRYVHNLYGKERHVIESGERITPGDHLVEYEFSKDNGLGGTGVLRCDGCEVARGDIPRFTPSGFSGTGVGLTCGYEWGPAVGTGYNAPFPFPGTIRLAVVRTTGPVVRDPLAELEAILSEQ